MGNNNVACFFRHIGSLPFPSQILLGINATINMKTSNSHKSDDGTFIEKAEVLYTVWGSECNLVLERNVCNDGNVNVVSFVLNDSIICSDKKQLRLQIFKEGTGLLRLHDAFTCSIPWTNTKKKVDARDGVTDTKVYLYGSTDRCGLLVLQCKKNYYNEDAKAVTVAHYFVSSPGSWPVNLTLGPTDVGFSFVAEIGVCDGKYEITVEGPERHPVSALLYMFRKVRRNGIWKPSMCPHCSNIWREHSRMFWQSDSEDNDDGRRQNAATIDNRGIFRGTGCGARVGRDFNVINNLREDDHDIPSGSWSFCNVL